MNRLIGYAILIGSAFTMLVGIWMILSPQKAYETFLNMNPLPWVMFVGAATLAVGYMLARKRYDMLTEGGVDPWKFVLNAIIVAALIVFAVTATHVRSSLDAVPLLGSLGFFLVAGYSRRRSWR